MYYVLILFLITTYFFINDRYLTGNKSLRLLIFIPPFYVYWFILAFQYDLGTDYFSYLDIVENGIRAYIEKNNEFGFIFIVNIIDSLALPPQSLFVIIGFIQSVLAFILFDKLSKSGFKLWIVFLLFFTVSTIYHNQMNGLRQFVAILSTPLFLMYIFEKKYFKGFIIALLGIIFHNSFLIIFLLLPFFLMLKKLSKKVYFILFLISPAIYLIGFSVLLPTLVEYIFENYAHYLDSTRVFSISSILTKIYYLPLFVLFWYLYLKDSWSNLGNSSIFKFFVLIFSITYCAYLTDVIFDFYGRFFQYFIVFYIFPIYYLFDYFYRKKSVFALSMLFMYIFVPYFFKVVIFPIEEYRFDTIIF